ncbi:hypothetical protein T492DRAFT_1149951, partial [Pavlovales sp. CCMP2436]
MFGNIRFISISHRTCQARGTLTASMTSAAVASSRDYDFQRRGERSHLGSTDLAGGQTEVMHADALPDAPDVPDVPDMPDALKATKEPRTGDERATKQWTMAMDKAHIQHALAVDFCRRGANNELGKCLDDIHGILVLGALDGLQAFQALTPTAVTNRERGSIKSIGSTTKRQPTLAEAALAMSWRVTSGGCGSDALCA